MNKETRFDLDKVSTVKLKMPSPKGKKITTTPNDEYSHFNSPQEQNLDKEFQDFKRVLGMQCCDFHSI